MEHLDLAGVITSTPINWTLPLFDQQDAIYLSSSRQMLEPILEETSEDEEHAQNSWNQYHETAATGFWNGSASESETGSVVRIEVNKDSDSISERDFACPAKRPRRADDFLQYLSGSTQQYYNQQSNQQPSSLDDTVILRRSQQQRAESVSESNANSLERFLALETAARDSLNIQRSSTGSSRRFDDYYGEADSLSYQSLSRSSSLIQFESLERQLLMQEQHASTTSLGNSSPSLLSFDGAVNNGGSGSLHSDSNSGNNSRRGSQSSLLKRYESSDGRLHQTYYDLHKINFDDDDSCPTITNKPVSLRFNSNSKLNVVNDADCNELLNKTESKSDTESSSSGSETGSGNSILNSKKPSAEDLSDAAISAKSTRIASFQRGGKNSAENLSEDSGYCEPSNLRRSKSKSIPKNFEKFCEEEEDFGNECTLILHSKSNNNNNNSKSIDDVDMCQTKIDDATFNVKEHAKDTVLDDNSAAACANRNEIPISSQPLETTFNAFTYASVAATSASSSPLSTSRFKNSPPRDFMSMVSIETQNAHRPTAHSPSPAASDISATGSSTSTTPSTCASAASFTWYGGSVCVPQQQQQQQLRYRNDEQAHSELLNEFSAQNFLLRNSLPDLREAYGSLELTENQFLYYKSERPTNGYVLGDKIKGVEVVENYKCDSTTTSPSLSTTTSSAATSPTNSERSDVTIDSPKTSKRRCSIDVCSERNTTDVVISDLCNFGRVSSVPSELHKVGRKKRASRNHQKYFTNVESSESNSETENCYSFDLNSLRRSCSWSERRQKFQEFQAKRRPKSLYGYMNASYQDLTQLDYTKEHNNQILLKRISIKESKEEMDNSTRSSSAGGADYENIICKGNFLLDELSEIYDRNASILNDKPIDEMNGQESKSKKNYAAEEVYANEDLLAAKMRQKPLHSPRPPPRNQRKHSNSSYSDLENSVSNEDVQHVQLTIRKPTARQKNGRRKEVLSDATDGVSSVGNLAQNLKTFDQDPTNLHTSYAQSLEKCDFDAKELSNTDLSTQKSRALPKRRFHSQATNSKQKNLVSSTPNLNAYDHGADDEAELEDELCVSSAHTSMHQLPQEGAAGGGGGGVKGQKPLGILLAAGSRTSFGKEVSFCPVVSKYSWQEQSSEEYAEQQNQQSPKDNYNENNNKVYESAQGDHQKIINNFAACDDDDLLCNDIDAKLLAYNSKANEIIATKLYDEASKTIITELYNKEHEKPKEEKDINTTIKVYKEEHDEEQNNELDDNFPSEERELCARFIADLREHELNESFYKQKRRKSHSSYTTTDDKEEQQPTTPITPSMNIVTYTKQVTSTDDLGEQQKTTTIITKRLMPSTSTEALTTNNTAATKSEFSHKTTFDSVGTESRVLKATENKNASLINTKLTPPNNSKTTSTRPLSIQLPILSEPPVNRAHHILYASQQMLDNFQKREFEEQQQQEQQEQENRLKAKSANNLTMSKSQQIQSDTIMVNNNNSLKVSKLKADEKHPNSKGFLSRFAHGFRFSLRRNKKKQQQLQKEQQQQQEQQTKPEFMPELQFNVVQQKKQAEQKSTKIKNSTKNDGKRGHSPDVIHIPLKAPLSSVTNSSNNNSTKGSSTFYTSSPNSSDISTTSTVNIDTTNNGAKLNSQANGNPIITVLPAPTMKLVTGKPPLPKQPPPPRTSSLPQNSKHAHQQPTAAVAAMSTSFMSKAQPIVGLPHQQQLNESCEDFLDAERSYYYDDFKNQLNSGMQANGGEYALNGIGADFTSPSRASVSQKTQMFNNMELAANSAQKGVRLSGVPNITHQQQQQKQLQPKQQQNANAGKIGLIETNLDTHETIITGKTRSLMDIGPSQLRFVNVGGKRLNMTNAISGRSGGGGGGVNNGDNVLIYDDDDNDMMDDHHVQHADGNMVVIKSTTPAGQIASVRRPHKSMEFLLDKENQKNVLFLNNDAYLKKKAIRSTNLDYSSDYSSEYNSDYMIEVPKKVSTTFVTSNNNIKKAVPLLPYLNTQENFKSIKFRGRKKCLSRRIDKFVYFIKNPRRNKSSCHIKSSPIAYTEFEQHKYKQRKDLPPFNNRDSYLMEQKSTLSQIDNEGRASAKLLQEYQHQLSENCKQQNHYPITKPLEPNGSSNEMQVKREKYEIDANEMPLTPDIACFTNVPTFKEKHSSFWITIDDFTISINIKHYTNEVLSLFYYNFRQRLINPRDLHFGIDNFKFSFFYPNGSLKYKRQNKHPRNFSNYWFLTDDLVITFSGNFMPPKNVKTFFKLLHSCIEIDSVIHFGVDNFDFTRPDKRFLNLPKPFCNITSADNRRITNLDQTSSDLSSVLSDEFCLNTNLPLDGNAPVSFSQHCTSYI